MAIMAVLEVYVGPGCNASEAARDMVENVNAVALPGLEIRLIDLSDPNARRPRAVFAIPTYILDGKVLSLGNPDEGWLLQQVTEVLG